MRYFWRRVGLAAGFLAVSAGPVLAPALVSAKIIDRVVAVVNEDAVTEFEWNQAVSLRLAGNRDAGKGLQNDKAFRRSTLEELIHSRLLEQEVEKSKIEVSEDELARSIRRFLGQNLITIEQLKSELLHQGIDFEIFKDRMEKELRHTKFIQQTVAGNVQVSEEDLRQYKEQNRKEWGEKIFVKVQLLHLPFEAGSVDGEELKEQKERAEKVAETARNAPDFRAFAEGLSKKKGPFHFLDDTGEFRTLDQLSAEVGSALGRMESDSVSAPIITPRGIYIAKLVEKKTGAESADTGRDQELMEMLFNKKMEQEIQSYLLSLRKKSYVEIRE